MAIEADLPHVTCALSNALDLVRIDDVGHALFERLSPLASMALPVTFHTFQILRHIDGFEEIAPWAAAHRETARIDVGAA